MAAYYPIMVRLSGKRCVVVGGGTVAERKVAALLEGGADEVIVVSPHATANLEELAAIGCIALWRREYQEQDSEGAFLLIAATNDRQLNSGIAAYADSRGLLVNTADLGETGSFITPSVVRRGELVIALTTGGASPALTALLKRRLAEQYGPAYGAFIDRLHALRKRVLAEVGDSELRAAVLRLAAEELPTEPGQETIEGGGGKVADAASDFEIEQWMIRLLQAAERGR
ncbi:bifunctional precorrin-2 dehydrogenase/sirohydrochlorin ferrochelatase [Paenibacillus rhizovicinus]|uniref:precorrin-2 dehydrogenase n=1 Tax=Paenibacillus rhizovicinus TaxID=2704463 RepID=A0A6C0P6L2_9BACL|nr:bifunctional precorrin-2 dehydrogenase/sirohydrochlorin ferrochelatase [Paenibacillus rhizovicinus]QHW34149.1 bifunctional precorrin-2 dehydrogenase/sirohydrochlorin ferrochelatase [Paenibacillus rhizovicinus]